MIRGSGDRERKQRISISSHLQVAWDLQTLKLPGVLPKARKGQELVDRRRALVDVLVSDDGKAQRNAEGPDEYRVHLINIEQERASENGPSCNDPEESGQLSCF